MSSWPDSYGLNYVGGPVYQPIVDFLVLSPLVTIMAIAGLVAALARPSSPNVRRLAWVTVACFVAFGILPKDIRYAAARAPMLALMARSVLTTLQLRPRALAVAALPLALAANAALEVWIFWMIFIIADVYDPVLVNLLRACKRYPERGACSASRGPCLNPFAGRPWSPCPSHPCLHRRPSAAPRAAPSWLTRGRRRRRRTPP